MKKGNSVSLDALKPLLVAVRRFQALLFFLLVSGGLFAAIFIIISIINLSSTTASSSDQIVNGTFDQSTIDRVEQNVQPSQPSGRISPFFE